MEKWKVLDVVRRMADHLVASGEDEGTCCRPFLVGEYL